MSTSLTRDTYFRGSRVPKTPPKSTKNAPKVPQKSLRVLHRFLTCFLSILAPFWDPLGLPLGTKIAKNEATLKGGRGSWRKLRAQGTQGRHQTPKIPPKTPHLDPKGFQNDPKRVPRTPQHEPKKSIQLSASTNRFG